MCGIVGFWSPNGGATVDLAQKMAAFIAHRGPDACGAWIDQRAELALGHRRLSIIDLSAAGHQPMLSACGRYVLSYNGEIYNHLDLRRELEDSGTSPHWRGHSDTETLLAAIAHWGVDRALVKLNGMFGFAVWDQHRRELVLARDRMGEKPLYYGRNNGTLFFGSELKAFAAHPKWSPEIDRDSLAALLRMGYVPGPRSIYRGVRKLLPGHSVTISDPSTELPGSVPYWSVAEAAERGIANPLSGDARELTDQLEVLLRDSVKLRMASDVPLGAFLSGGYDSSIVAALMQAQSTRPVKTFTIGFEEKAYNEAEHAKAVARHLGTEHTEMYVSPGDALEVIPLLPQIYDEPFADSSQLPTFLLSRLTREHVTVSLSGDGGDELFCGYNRYVQGYGYWKRFGSLPGNVRNSLAWAMLRTPRAVSATVERLLPSRLGVRNIADRLPKLAEVLKISDEAGYYRSLVSHWRNAEEIVLGTSESDTWQHSDWGRVPTMLDRMMLADMRSYLPDDILVKVDRASMAVSLEARVPLLDHRLVEYAWRVPLGCKYRDGQGKWLLREVLHRYVPREIMERPKMGFGVPIDEWLCGPLRDWAEALIDEGRLREEGFLNPGPIRARWREHLGGNRRWHYSLWNVLMFQSWLETNKLSRLRAA